MKCPKCNCDLEKRPHEGIEEVDYCNQCKGMWLDFDELDQLEDRTFSEDGQKGSLMLSPKPTEYLCPHCQSKLLRFKYRFHDLELEYCENQHGFWLDEGEEHRILELMEARSKDMKRKFSAEVEWNNTIHQLKSKSFFTKMKGLFK